ncbi:MAG TPA: RluA family pseudouridine synthase [Xanthobacteraceae bacterium]|nr:RluA family pseudouridine synthase [Xanthobacteraceae bacterium]
MRGSRGPRQPGGGKQISGPRHRPPHVHRHPEVAAKRPSKGDGPGRSSFEARQGLPSGQPLRAGPVGRAPQDDGEPGPQGERATGSGVQNVTVSADEAGMRVDRFFEARFPGLSFSHIQRVIRKGEVRVNGKRTQPKNRLEAGQTVRVPPLRLDPPKPRTAGNAADQKTADFLKSITLYEDADTLVLNKPMGLAVQGGSGTTRHLDGMLEVMRDAHGQRPRLVHRLDKDTAGCLLVAKTRFAAAALAKSFRSRSARKIYWALVAGVPKPRQGRISTFLAKEQREDESMMRIARHGEEGASHAVTYYAVVETAGSALAWLSLKPVTGRTHQLRAHMAHIGHPIVGDAKYFARENWQLPGGMQNRLHLLARRIAVSHPRGGVIDATAPLPPHMQQSWNLLGLDARRYDPIEDAPEG